MKKKANQMSRRGFIEKVALAGAGAALLPAMLSPAAAQSNTPRRKVIFVTHSNDPFFVPVRKGFETFGKLRGWETQFLGKPVQDTQETLKLMESAVAAKPDGVGFTRIDTTSFDDVILKAKKAGIAVMLYNVASAGYKELGVGFVGQDFVPAGRTNGLQVAKYAQQITGRKDGLIVLCELAAGNSALEQRTEGARQGVEEYNKKNGTNYTTEVFITDGDQAKAIARIDAKWTAKKDQIVGWAHADQAIAYGAAWAADRGLTGKFANGGFDLIPAILSAIDKGYAQWSIGQNPYAQGWVTSSLLDMMMEAGYPGYSYDTGSEIVDKSNIKAVIAREAKFSK
ncbi:MAG: substrate-binding domain-containing protein [Thermaceae bacterium]|nr:substrate-binding domain-containing protein [Thermaceae bacterium]